MSEKPVRDRPRRLADWLNPTGDKKVHSLVDKVYKRWNLEDAWLRVKGNGGAGGVDGQALMDFEQVLDKQLDRLHEELKSDTYQPLPVRRHLIPKAGQPGKFRPLGIPTIYDRVCQQALLNRLEPIFEPVFDDASFGYRKGRSTKDALRKVWKELGAGGEGRGDGGRGVDRRRRPQRFLRYDRPRPPPGLPHAADSRRCAASTDRQLAERGGPR